MGKNNNIKIDINPFKVMWNVRKEILSKAFLIVWLILFFILILFYILSYKFTIIKMEAFSLSDFLTPGITGLSFTLALITATTRIFSKDKLVDIYCYTDKDNPIEGYLFYRTIAPYIWTSTIWLIVTIGSLFSKLFIYNFLSIFQDILKLIFSAFVLMGVMSLWSLLIAHIKDVSLETEREIKEHIKKEEHQ